MQLWKMRNAEDVRTELGRRRRGRPIDERVWAPLRDGRFDDRLESFVREAKGSCEADAEELEQALDGIAELIRDLETYFPLDGTAPAALPAPGRSEPLEPVRGTPDPALAALARLAAQDASQRPEVEAFRRKALRGALLPVGGIAAWVEDPRNSLKPRKLPRKLLSVEEIEAWVASGGKAARLIAYPSAAGPPKTRPIRQGSPLERLADLVARLVTDYGWTEPGAVAFVLAGYAPRPSLGSAGVTLGQSERAPELQHRVRLDVHPTVSARDVASLYEKTRRRFFGARSTGYRKAAGADAGRSWPALAAHVASVNDGRTWREALVEWNRGPAKGRPKWAYPPEQLGSFIGHARKAYRSFVGSDLAWKNAKGSSAARSAHRTHTKAARAKRRSA